MTPKNLIRLLCFLLISLSAAPLFAKTIHILYFNDFHGQVTEDNKNPGMEKFASVVKAQEKKYPNYILVAGGDNYQGSIISNLTYGEPVNAMMNYLNVSASAVGNHDFDWTMKWFPTWQQQGHFAYLAANIFTQKTHQPVNFAKPYIIVNRDGIKIAIIGLSTTETPFTTIHTNVANLEFQTAEKAAQGWIDYLNSGRDKAGKPDAIIALTHIASKQTNGEIKGKEISSLIKNTKGFDAILSAHSHQPVADKLDNMPILQAYANGPDLGDLILTFNAQNKLVKVTPTLTQIYKHKKNIKLDPQMTKVYNQYYDKFKQQMSVEIGEATRTLQAEKKGERSPLGHWVCQVIKEQTGAQITLQNEGFFRHDLMKGPITLGRLYQLFPFDNTAVVLNMTGQDIKQAIEHGLNDDMIDATQYAGMSFEQKNKKVISMMLDDGTPIKMDQYYTVATSNFMQGNGDGYQFSTMKQVSVHPKIIRDIIEDYIKAKKQIP